MQVKTSQFFGYKLEPNSEIWRYFKKIVKMCWLQTQKIYINGFSHIEISFNQIDKFSQKKRLGLATTRHRYPCRPTWVPFVLFFILFSGGALFNGILGLPESDESLAKKILFSKMLKFSSTKKEIPNKKIVGRKILKIQEFFFFFKIQN